MSTSSFHIIKPPPLPQPCSGIELRMTLLLRNALKLFVVLAIMLPLLVSAATPPATVANAAEVVATQGGVNLTFGDIDNFAATVPEEDRGQLFNSRERLITIIRNLLIRKQMVKEAHDLGLENDPAVKDQIAYAIEGVLVDARRKALEKKFRAEMPDMEQLARERYMANPDEFMVPKNVTVQHILISTEERSDGEALALAKKLYAELQADPSKFEALVMEYSDDPSKKNNHGRITNGNSDSYVKPFSEAADSLTKVGEIVGPVRTKYGYHIIKAIKIEPAHRKSFAEVKATLVPQMKQEWVAKNVQRHIDLLRSREQDVNFDLLKQLPTRYDNAASDAKWGAAGVTKLPADLGSAAK